MGNSTMKRKNKKFFFAGRPPFLLEIQALGRPMGGGRKNWALNIKGVQHAGFKQRNQNQTRIEQIEKVLFGITTK